MNDSVKLTIAAAFLATGASLSAADIEVDRVIDTDTTWTADNTYFLDGYTFVVTPAGATEPTILTIEPGTVIKGRAKDSEAADAEAAALVITAGAQIMAEGTAQRPIIFTSELDDLNGNLGIEDTNLWGGVVVLGNASINSRADSEVVSAPVVDQVEGFSVTEEEVPWISFGGTDDEDNSGVLRYISIRHGGDVLGTANEINGLTMGGLGSGTTVEYIEVFANKDDGFEWFGGTVNARYLVAAFGNDDSFDYDQGWRGKGQFWFTIGTDIDDDSMDRGGEHDGATNPLDAAPLGEAIVYNATYIGIGPSGRANIALNPRDNAGTEYYNSIFVNFAEMLLLEDDLAVDASGNVGASTDRVNFENNIWWSHIAENNNAVDFTASSGALNADFAAAFFTDTSFNNWIVNPQLTGISYTDDGALNPVPAAGSPAFENATATSDDDWFLPADYIGAFGPDYNWLAGWTKLDRDGYLASSPGYFRSDALGWVYKHTDAYEGGWVFSYDLDKWVWIYEDRPRFTITAIEK